MWILLVLLGLLWPLPMSAAILCNGDDNMDGAALSNYFTATDATISLWFTGAGTSPTDSTFCTDVASHQYVVGNTTGSTVRIHITRHSATEICGMHRDTVPVTTSITGTHTDGTPAHVALVHTGGTLAMYINGVLVAAPSSSGNTAALTNTLRLCGSNGFTGLNGTLDLVALYNVALSAGEVAAIAGARSTGIYKTMPTALWTFDTGADGASAHGVAIRDLSGNGRTVTGNDGADNLGMTFQSSTVLRRWGGVQ